MLRSAVIGTGFVGPFHIDAIRRGGYADVVALAGTDAARTAKRALDLGVPLATTDIALLLGDPTIDVVHICTPNRTHVELATAALRRVIPASRHRNRARLGQGLCDEGRVPCGLHRPFARRCSISTPVAPRPTSRRSTI